MSVVGLGWRTILRSAVGSAFGWVAAGGMPLAPDLVEEDGGGGGDIERIDPAVHGDRDLVVTGVADLGGETFPLVAEDDAAIPGEGGLGQDALVGVGMSGDAAHPASPEFAEGGGEGHRFNEGQAEHVAHRRPHGPAEVGMGAGFADDQGGGAEGRGGADDAADVLGVGEGVHRHEESWARGEAVGDIEFDRGRDAGAGEEALVHREAGEGFEEGFVAEEHGDRFGACLEEGAQDLEVIRRHEGGEHGQVAAEEAFDHLLALGDEHPFPVMLDLQAHRPIGREFGVMEIIDEGHPQHPGMGAGGAPRGQPRSRGGDAAGSRLESGLAGRRRRNQCAAESTRLTVKTTLTTFALASFLVLPAVMPHAAGAEAAPAYAPRVAGGTLGRIVRLDPALDALVAPDARIEILADGFDWSEGPVWMTRGGYLLFSDVPRNVIWRWREFEPLTEYLRPSGATARPWSGGTSGANGLTVDNEGRLILCQHGDRQVARLRSRGRWEALATNFQGKRFNSPNDLVLRSNGEIYFTDPAYGLEKGLDDPRKEIPFQGVYRVSRWGRVSLLVDDLKFPNGVAFSPDEKVLYIAVSDPEAPRYMAYDVERDGGLANGRVLFDASPLRAGRPGLPDGLKVDDRGNLWATGPGGVLVLTPQGRHLGTVETGQATANCAWGGDGSVLYLTAHRYLCRVATRVKGIIPGPLAEEDR